MLWVHGGVWRESGSGGGASGILRLCPPAGAEAPRGIVLATDDLSTWDAHVGGPMALRLYDVTPATAEAVVRAYEAFVASFPFETDLSGSGDHSPEAVAGLCNLLAKFGPLGFVPGVVPWALSRWPSLDAEINSEAWEVNAYHFRGEVEDIVGVHRTLEAIRRRQLDADAVAASIVHAATEIGLRDMAVEPVLRSPGISYDARPLTLRAMVWKWLLWRLGRIPRQICVYCNEPFELTGGPGQPPLYCPDHRGSKFRHAVKANRAPAMQIPPEFDEED